MLGIYYDKYGPANETVELSTSLPAPTSASLGAGDILVRQLATSINPVDYKMIVGNLRVVETFRKFPIIPCFDVCGVIEAIGPKCAGTFQVGDKIIGFQHFARRACAAELVVIQERFCAPMPTNVTPVEAAGIPLVGVTSYQALIRDGKLKEGERVLILGGSGGTGLYAVQIAKAVGAHVTVTCGARNADLLRSLGADQVIDYRSANWWEVLTSPPDLIYDCVGGPEVWPHAQQLQSSLPHSRFVTIVGDNPDYLGTVGLMDTGVRALWRLVVGLMYSPTYTISAGSPGDESLREVAKLVQEGKIKCVVDSVYDVRNLEGVRSAFAKQMSQRAVGKIVLSFEGNGMMKNEAENQPTE